MKGEIIMDIQNQQNEPTQYSDLSRDELELILYFLQCIYNRIDGSDKKNYYMKKIKLVKELINISDRVLNIKKY